MIHPILFFIPMGETLRASNDRPRYARFKKLVRKRHPDLIVVDLMDYEFDRNRFNIRPFNGHASAYGNEVIADIIEDLYRKLDTRNSFDRNRN